MNVIKWDEEALESLKKIGDKRKQEKVKKKVEGELSQNPYKGKLLSYYPKGTRSFHCLGNKFRVVYQIFQAKN